MGDGGTNLFLKGGARSTSTVCKVEAYFFIVEGCEKQCRGSGFIES